MRLNAGALSFNVVDVGAGDPALLFLHYWGGSARTWGGVTSRLSENNRCIAYDQRGWGSSDAPSDGYSIADLARDAKEIAQALQITRFVLVGHSMGGKAAQLLASQRPEGLEGLVLVAPAAPTPQSIPAPAREQQLHAYDNRENALHAIAFLTFRMPPADIQEQIISYNFAGAPQAKLAWPTAAAYEDISVQVKSIAVPTLLVAGEHDRQDPLEQHRREILPRIPQAKLIVIPECGHLVPIDQPKLLADAIRVFIRSVN
jgi:pimeloyl-ACP methyl ester carboxylesterase